MTIQRRRFLHLAGGGTMIGLVGCAGQPSDAPTEAAATDTPGPVAVGQESIGDGELVLATTTSTWDTGLLNAIHPAFEARFGLRVKAIPRGTGAALRTARDGDADAVLVHARPAEDEFLRAGHGINRRDVMENDFVVVGPPGDPADIDGMTDPGEAFAAIARVEESFISRGDDSGTHQKEASIWATIPLQPAGQWYQVVGKGMGDTLVQASQIGAYTLTDRGTFQSMRDRLNLAVMVEGPLNGGSTHLRNPYGVMAVNPAAHPAVNYEAAMAYIGFLTGPDGQDRIERYRVRGEPLFVPTALTGAPRFEQYGPGGC